MDREWSDIIIVFVEDSLFLLVFKVIITIDYIYRLVKWGCLKSSSRDCSFVNNWRAWSGVQGCSEVSFKWVTSYVIDTCVKPFLLRTQCRLRMSILSMGGAKTCHLLRDALFQALVSLHKNVHRGAHGCLQVMGFEREENRRVALSSDLCLES